MLATVGAGALVPLWLAIPFLAAALALYSSLQHEVLHGHPFPSERLSEATVFPAWGLLLPYGRFKATHLTHHFDPNLTDPYDDPETNYLEEADFNSKHRWFARVLEVNNTLAGRMLIGPFLGFMVFYAEELRLIRAGNRAVIRDWLVHLVALLPVVLWLAFVAGIPLWAYAVAVYASVSILKVRTFLEHQAHEDHRARSVLIEDRGLLSFLFLNNNLHAVHHAHPGLAWYRLPAAYAARRETFRKRNGGYVYRSYGEIFRSHLLWAKDPVVHPLWSRRNRRGPLRQHPE